MSSSHDEFRRYTNLAAALHILQSRKITLLDPASWEDKNDTFFLSEYRRLKKAKSVLAMCFANRGETYHHWQVFSKGSDGVCFQFNADPLKSAFVETDGVIHGPIRYEFLSSAQKMTEVNIEILPFMKRWPYGDEEEYRVVYVDMNKEIPCFDIQISLSWINRITLSPWLPSGLVPAVKRAIKSIDGCRNTKVYKSTLLDNKEWKRLTGRAAPMPVAP